MHNVEQTLLKRGLFRLGTAKSQELSNFSGASVDDVDTYLATRPDLVHPREPGGPWMLMSEAREPLMTEITEGIRRDPERLSDHLQPQAIERLRRSLDTIEGILDDVPSGIVDERLMIPARLSMMGKTLREMRRHGRDVDAEEARLKACEARVVG